MTRQIFALAAIAIGCGVAIAVGADVGLVMIVAGTGVATLLLAATPEAAAPSYHDPAQDAPRSEPIEDNQAFRAIIMATPDPILVVRGGRVTAANDAARELLGTHIVGNDVRTAIRHPAAAERLANPRPGSSGGTIDLVGLGKMNRRLEMRTIALPDTSRFVILTDRTAIDTAETARADFVANASHELRTPLAAILGFIETLSDPDTGSDIATRQRFLSVMEKEAKRMQRLVDDLLSLSRIEASKFRAPTEAVDLADLAKNVVAEISNANRKAADNVVIEHAQGIAPVRADRAQLSQLLHNIIGNALKYGAADKPVTIGLKNAGANMVELSVADQGDGIPAEHLPRLTERFYRVDSARSRALGGTGLGLSIAKHIVERHRGRMDIASRQGRGTNVTILLPAHDGATAGVTAQQS